LAERNIEREHVPAALELGTGITPWSPLASGLLTGRYQRKGGLSGEGRLHAVREHPALAALLSERNWTIAEELVKVAKEIGRSPAQVSSTIIGATKIEQLDDNLASLDFAMPAELLKRLEEISAPEVFIRTTTSKENSPRWSPAGRRCGGLRSCWRLRVL